MKITFNYETKRFKDFSNYDELVKEASKAFNFVLIKSFKFYYADKENDIISVTSQEDLD